MTQVGNWIIVGGTFTTVRNAGSSTDIPRRNLFAFNATTGQVSTTFAPNPNSTVYKVQAAPVATVQSVYVGGNFTSVTSGGATVSVSRLYKVDREHRDPDHRFPCRAASTARSVTSP